MKIGNNAGCAAHDDEVVVIDSEVKKEDDDADDEEINSKWPCHQTNQIARGAAKPQKPPPETSKITLSRNVVKWWCASEQMKQVRRVVVSVANFSLFHKPITNWLKLSVSTLIFINSRNHGLLNVAINLSKLATLKKRGRHLDHRQRAAAAEMEIGFRSQILVFLLQRHYFSCQ